MSDEQTTYTWDASGALYEAPTADVAAMAYPVRHQACGKIHDAGMADIVERYVDCTRWRCPHCKVMCDDRPIGWGGNVVKVEVPRKMERP